MEPIFCCKSISFISSKKGPSVFLKPGWLSFFSLLIPVLVLASVTFLLASFLFLGVFYYLLAFVCFWSLTRTTAFSHHEDILNCPEQSMEMRIQLLYAPLFWLAVSGSPVVLIGYVVLRESQLLSQQESLLIPCKEQVSTCFYWLNWIPVKLLGLTFALVGNFNGVFSTWRSALFDYQQPHSSVLANLMKLALSDTDTPSYKNSTSGDESVVSSVVVQSSDDHLCQHALVAWLVGLLVLQLVVWLA